MKKILPIILALFVNLGTMNLAFSFDGADQLRAFSRTVKSAQGEFLQQQIAKGFGETNPPKVIRQFSGNFTFIRPGKFIWQTVKPYEQKMIADGKQLLMWDKDLNQVTYRSASQVLAATPAAILFGDTNLDAFFELQNVGDKEGLSWLELLPKTTGKATDNLPFSKVGVGMKDNLPVAMELRDALDNTILLTFSQIKINQTIPKEEFQFIVPKGAEVVKMK